MTAVPTPGRVDIPAHRRIADAMREEILAEKLRSGFQLPSTGELASKWNASSTTIHKALLLLAKEGWVARHNGAGTFVADPVSRFTCAGIYHASDIFTAESNRFARAMNASLLAHFHRLGKETQVFIDSRPENEQIGLPATLSKAIGERRIQCLVSLWIPPPLWSEFARLKIPTAFSFNPHSPNCVEFDAEDLLRESARRAAAQGCRSIGVISSVDPSSPRHSSAIFYQRFATVMQAAGLETRPEWIIHPNEQVLDFETYGYDGFRRLWLQKEKPDALLAYPDSVVRGVIMAVLRSGYEKVTQDMKFLFHRNSKIGILCPFDATWAISDEEVLSDWMIRIIQKQFNGEPVAPMEVPYQFEDRRGVT